MAKHCKNSFLYSVHRESQHQETFSKELMRRMALLTWYVFWFSGTLFWIVWCKATGLFFSFAYTQNRHLLMHTRRPLGTMQKLATRQWISPTTLSLKARLNNTRRCSQYTFLINSAWSHFLFFILFVFLFFLAVYILLLLCLCLSFFFHWRWHQRCDTDFNSLPLTDLLKNFYNWEEIVSR